MTYKILIVVALALFMAFGFFIKGAAKPSADPDPIPPPVATTTPQEEEPDNLPEGVLCLEDCPLIEL